MGWCQGNGTKAGQVRREIGRKGHNHGEEKDEQEKETRPLQLQSMNLFEVLLR